jgi:hypothetical protein
MIFSVAPFFTETHVSARYWLDTERRPEMQWLVSDNHKSVGMALEPAKAFMRSLPGHQRLRVLLPVQGNGRGFATFSLGDVRTAIEIVAGKCGMEFVSESVAPHALP